MLKGLLAILVIAAALFGWWALSGYPAQGQICEYTQAGYKDCSTHIIFFVALSYVEKFLNDVSPALTAIATAAIAYFTWTIKAISDEELANTHPIERAYLSAGGVWERISTLSATPTGHPFTSSVTTENFQLHINNHGKTPGRLLEVAVEFCDASVIPAQPTYNRIYNPDFIGPGTQSRPYGGFPVPTQLANPVVYGRLWYRDIFTEQVHSCGFIQSLDRKAKSTSLIQPPSDTYTSWD